MWLKNSKHCPSTRARHSPPAFPLPGIPAGTDASERLAEGRPLRAGCMGAPQRRID